jgi:hypothetical protein
MEQKSTLIVFASKSLHQSSLVPTRLAVAASPPMTASPIRTLEFQVNGLPKRLL